MRSPTLPLAANLLLVTLAGAAEPIRLIPRILEKDGISVAFPAVTYRPPATTTPVAAVCAATASAALGTTVDPKRDLIAETEHRVVLRDPTDPARILKLYRPDRYAPLQAAKLLQRDLGLERYLANLGLRLAMIDRSPRLLDAGVIRQQRIDGTSLADLYPHGYTAGANPAVDRVLARIAPVEPALVTIVGQQSGMLITNTVDCWHERRLGIDLGHCYGNIFIERGSGAPVFIDW
jgi:hypothetical protein